MSNVLRARNSSSSPGGSWSANAAYTSREINDIKTSRGKKYLILDGGMNHHLAASGNLGQVMKRNFPMAILNKLDIPASETVDVVGPLCTPLDTLGRSVQLSPPEVGDLARNFSIRRLRKDRQSAGISESSRLPRKFGSKVVRNF